MDTNIVERLKKIMALTTSPVEGEAQAATAMLAKLLTDHNLSIADLESKGHKPAPGIKADAHDLGKAAFTWKLNLAEAIADHFYCHSMVNRTSKTVQFVGRPDNVDSLRALYAWVIDQIKRIASDERRTYQETTGEHIDPLRWQVNFGVGAVERLTDRLEELRKAQSVSTTALVIHHQTEISDYLEDKLGYRVDGQQTKAQRERAERYAKTEAVRKASKADAEAAGNLELHYVNYPWDRPYQPEPMTKAQTKAQERRDERANDAWDRKQARRNQAEDRRWDNPAYAKQQDQAATSRRIGRKAADKVNLQPFIAGGTDAGKVAIEARIDRLLSRS